MEVPLWYDLNRICKTRKHLVDFERSEKIYLGEKKSKLLFTVRTSLSKDIKIC